METPVQSPGDDDEAAVPDGEAEPAEPDSELQETRTASEPETEDSAVPPDVTGTGTETEAEAQPEAAPEPPILARQRRECERSGGQLQSRGAGLFVCARTTRDAGRRCSANAQCEGMCLARSETCAPFTPLFGCHEVLLAPGSRVTQCLD